MRWPLFLRLAAFRSLEALSHLRLPSKPAEGHGAPPTPGALWLYATTIGELNAVEPLVGPLLQALGQPPLVLLTHHSHYTAAYLRKYPQARVEVLDGSSAQAWALARRCPPRLLAVAEIPCLLHDAPCRFSYATLRAARRAGAPAVLVNGWLYGYRPGSRMDALEARLFSRSYVQGFNLMLVQTEAVRQRLLQAGAEPARVHVTGNLKYDAMRAAAAAARPGPLGQALADAPRQAPLLVAGSVTETEDQQHLLQAFAAVHARHPGARLVLAPRHPENQPRMQALQQLLQQLQHSHGLGHQFRSHTTPARALAQPVLVLDTMGELRDCYAAADIAYVGADHNVLEPLMHGTPVFVSGTWEPSYPSFPVFQQMLQAGAIEHVGELRQLGPCWLARLEAWSPGAGLPAAAAADATGPLARALAQACGATQRQLAALRQHRLLA